MSRGRSDNWLPELISNSCVLLQRGRHWWARDCVSWSFLSWTPLRSPILQNGLTGLQAGAVCVPILKKTFLLNMQIFVFCLFFLLCVHPDTSSQHGNFLSDTQRLGFPYSRGETVLLRRPLALFIFSSFLLSQLVQQPNANSLTVKRTFIPILDPLVSFPVLPQSG